MRTFLLIFGAWNATLWFILGWLFAPLLPGGWLAVVVLAVGSLLPLRTLARAFGGDLYPSATARLWIVRPFWYVQLALPLLAVAGLVGTVMGLVLGDAMQAGRWSVGGMATLFTIGALWGYAGSRQLRVHALDLSFADLPPGLDGLRIAQLSDLHVGPHTSRRHLARVAREVRNAEPDLVVLTGDQVDDFAGDVAPLGQAFADLAAPLGVIAIPGNHDVYAGWAAVRRGMERLGWRVLVNAALEVEREGARFWVAGTGDPAGRGGPRGPQPGVVPDIERTLRAIPHGAFVLALAHNPELWPELADHGVDLTLSGHTHYGQLAIPSLGWSMASPFLSLAMGIHRRGKSVLYINPGTNFWGIPFRIGTPPEVTVVTLHCSPVAAAGEMADNAPARSHL